MAINLVGGSTTDSNKPTAMETDTMHAFRPLQLCALMALASMASLATAATHYEGAKSTAVIKDGWLYTNTQTATGQALVTAVKPAAVAGVIGVGDTRVYGAAFDKGRKLSVNQWQAVLSMDAYPENSTTNYQDPGPWRYCEVDYEAAQGISDYRGNTFGPVGVTTVGDFPDYFKKAFAPNVLGKPNATNADMLAWGVQVTGVPAASFKADDSRLDPYPNLARSNATKRAALGKICQALQAAFDTKQVQYVMSHYAHIDNDKLQPVLTALKGLGFTNFSSFNLVGLAFQVQVNTGSIASASSFSSVRQAGNCGSMSAETCFATYLTDQYIRWLKSPSLGDDASNCWRANMALDIYKKDPTMSSLTVVNQVINGSYPNNSGKCPTSGVRWSKNMAWQ
ncbi:hypothetical protein [Paucibacter sp. DJ2R-2]|uniref:hypothetical protein n=1 Tax=Paucibacter sp. DJ2R-2 TaxID=2893558 RepID=UPI0021E3E69E|nr:hypothetical protein [Paucibacter sp. DJ2R-2]MCV2438607.1 hypothetical protein [Paucibacter sp. DJ2R-2]